MMQKSIPLLFILCSFMVTACASSGSTPKAPTSKITSTPSTVTKNSARPALESQAIDRAMQNALANAEVSGNAQEIIATLAQIHSRTPDDAIIATRYARTLREDDQINKAQRVLKPFTGGATPNVEAVTEMAMTQLELGNYKSAKSYGIQATNLDPNNARGFLALGTAQDAMKDHQNAEISFRQGLKNWKGDPSPILNNLALNLASQGHLEESLSLLERALAISPKRLELERNRRIIATLLETSGPVAPSPYRKPEVFIPQTAKPVAKPVVEQRIVEEETQQEVIPQTKKSIERQIEQIAPEEKMQVNVNAVTSVKVKSKTNIKLRPQN